jgi:hypothetical protein
MAVERRGVEMRKAKQYTNCHGVGVTVRCIKETVNGITAPAASSRAGAWEKAAPNKDLDWLFRPLGYTEALYPMVIEQNGSRVFSKGGTNVTAQELMHKVGITRAAATTRCEKWIHSNWGVDWLFRSPRDISQEFRIESEPKTKAVVVERVSHQVEYITALRKQWGLKELPSSQVLLSPVIG